MNTYEYVWIGGENELRSKTRVMKKKETLTDIPSWNYDGSSTKQTKGNDSEVIIKPVKMIKDPFREDGDMLVLCETYKPDGIPLSNNHRVSAKQVFDKYPEEKPWFGLEQEYFLVNPVSGFPLGFDNEGRAAEQGRYYCSIGTGNAFGRIVVEEHLRVCIKAGLTISGINAEVAPGQWEFQIGPVEGIDASDQLLLARYMLERIAEKYTLNISYSPKLLKGNWNGSGCHTNFSTKHMREGIDGKTGLEYIEDAIVKLSLKHKEHMAIYGKNNDKRMTGEHETASYDKFNKGVGNRGASIRIGNETNDNKKGYFEDRRPGANINPYQVTSMLLQTSME
mgnify:FL=1|tara:strand:+ start:1341 stop:2351 length:1011 start_codon:yes stop_codon:yes gene_type:complete